MLPDRRGQQLGFSVGTAAELGEDHEHERCTGEHSVRKACRKEKDHQNERHKAVDEGKSEPPQAVTRGRKWPDEMAAPDLSAGTTAEVIEAIARKECSFRISPHG